MNPFAALAIVIVLILLLTRVMRRRPPANGVQDWGSGVASQDSEPPDRADNGLSAADAVGGLSWVVLVIHVVGAGFIWANVESEIGVAVGLGVLFEGIVFCVTLRCLHWIGLNVAALRQGDGAPPN